MYSPPPDEAAEALARDPIDPVEATERFLEDAAADTDEPGKDEIVGEGTAGYVVTYGDALYRALDAVERLRKDGIDVGLVNKPTLNVVDEETLARIAATPFVLVIEPLARKNGLGAKLGTWLLQRGLTPKYDHVGVHREGCGGLWEHAYHQGYDPASIMAAVKKLL